MALHTDNFYLDVSASIHDRMRRHAQRLPKHLQQSLADSQADLLQSKLALATVLIPALLQQAIAMYQADHARALLLCDQSQDIRIFHLHQQHLAQAVDWASADSLTDLAMLLQVYDPECDAVVIMLGRTSMQTLWLCGNGDIRSAGQCPLARQPRRPFAPTPEQLIDQVAELYRGIHQHDPKPASEAERQAAVVMMGLQDIITNLILNGVAADIVESALFYHWLRLNTLSRGFDEAVFEAWSSRMPMLASQIVLMLRSLVDELPDDGPSVEMAQLGSKLQQLKNLYTAAAKEQQRRTRRQLERQVEKSNEALFGQIGKWLKEEINPAMIESAVFYYWLRSSTINANIEEAFFQKLERHWEEVVGRVDQYIDKLDWR